MSSSAIEALSGLVQSQPVRRACANVRQFHLASILGGLSLAPIASFRPIETMLLIRFGLQARSLIKAVELTSKHLSRCLHLWPVDKSASVAFFALSVLTSCSYQKSISRDELASKLRSADSVAAETDAFVDYVMQQRATQKYAKGHVEYLLSEIADTSKELGGALPPAGAEAQFDDYRKEMEALAASLRELRRNINQPEELAREQGRIAAIRTEIERTISSL